MTRILLIVLIVVTFSCTMTVKAQGINNSNKEVASKNITRDNYYDYQVNKAGITTSWLRRDEALQTIVEELEKFGYPRYQFNIINLYQLEDSSLITLDAYIYKTKCGILYNTGHSGEVKKTQRDRREYDQYIKSSSGGSTNKLYKNLPTNIIVLQETWYWYQYSSDNTIKPLINKATIIEILRQDIQYFLKDFEKTK